MPPVGFETTISVGERLQTYALDRAAAGTGIRCTLVTPNSPITISCCKIIVFQALDLTLSSVKETMLPILWYNRL